MLIPKVFIFLAPEMKEIRGGKKEKGRIIKKGKRLIGLKSLIKSKNGQF